MDGGGGGLLQSISGKRDEGGGKKKREREKSSVEEREGVGLDGRGLSGEDPLNLKSQMRGETEVSVEVAGRGEEGGLASEKHCTLFAEERRCGKRMEEELSFVGGTESEESGLREGCRPKT